MSAGAFKNIFLSLNTTMKQYPLTLFVWHILAIMCSRLRRVGVFVCAIARAAEDVGLWQQTQLGQTIAHNNWICVTVPCVNG